MNVYNKSIKSKHLYLFVYELIVCTSLTANHHLGTQRQTSGTSSDD